MELDRCSDCTGGTGQANMPFSVKFREVFFSLIVVKTSDNPVRLAMQVNIYLMLFLIKFKDTCYLAGIFV